MSRYVIKATGVADWRGYQNCEIGISIGNPCHDGDKLRSIVTWACKRFNRCIITLSDTLNRYTLMCDGMDEAQAYYKTRKIGDQWLADNMQTLRDAGDKCKLHRWEEWLAHPEYEKIYHDICVFRDADPGLAAALMEDATRYLMRRSTRGEAFDYDRALENSLNFFVEEIACYVLIGRTYRGLRAYPARDMSCFAYMRGPTVPEHLKGLELAPHIELNFKKKIPGENEDTALGRAA